MVAGINHLGPVFGFNPKVNFLGREEGTVVSPVSLPQPLRASRDFPLIRLLAGCHRRRGR